MPIPRGTKAGTIELTYLCQICQEKKPVDEFDLPLLGVRCNECPAAPIVSSKRIEHIFDDEIEKKHCCKCKEYKDIERYNPCKTSWDKLRPECKDCLHVKRVGNKANMTEYNKKYWEKTKVEQSAKHKVWVQNNKEHVREKNKAYRLIHGKEIDKRDWQKRKSNTAYRKSHNAYKKKYEKHKRATDSAFKIKSNYLRRMREMIPAEYRPDNMLSLLGCSIDRLLCHLEYQFNDKMTWHNNTLDGWHVDHIVPCDYFDLKNPIHQRRCFHWSNLQPLWGKENMSKNNKMTTEAYKVLTQLEYIFPDEPEFDSDDEEDYEEFRTVTPQHEICNSDFSDSDSDSESEEEELEDNEEENVKLPELQKNYKLPIRRGTKVSVL